MSRSGPVIIANQEMESLFAEGREINKAHTSTWADHVIRNSGGEMYATKDPVATASAFADWVKKVFEKDVLTDNQKNFLKELRVGTPYRKVNGKLTHQEVRMMLGKFGDKQIEDLRLWANVGHPGAMDGEWALEYLRPDPDGGVSETGQTVLYASDLTVNGQPMRCCPDAVLRHKKRRDVIVIERKVAFIPRAKIPPQGWPNIKAQLWVYSMIDNWKDADHVYLIGDIWWGRHTARYGRDILPEHVPIYPRWKRDDESFQDFGCRLFANYGGLIKSRSTHKSLA